MYADLKLNTTQHCKQVPTFLRREFLKPKLSSITQNSRIPAIQETFTFTIACSSPKFLDDHLAARGILWIERLSHPWSPALSGIFFSQALASIAFAFRFCISVRAYEFLRVKQRWAAAAKVVECALPAPKYWVNSNEFSSFLTKNIWSRSSSRSSVFDHLHLHSYTTIFLPSSWYRCWTFLQRYAIGYGS
jgi:hypothetical protein